MRIILLIDLRNNNKNGEELEKGLINSNYEGGGGEISDRVRVFNGAKSMCIQFDHLNKKSTSLGISTKCSIDIC